MALKIRLARGGSKKHPFYRIVVAEASSPRDGRFVERLGSYDPMVAKDHQNRVTLNNERITYWMSKGAKPTLRVHKILAGAGILDAPIIRLTTADTPAAYAPTLMEAFLPNKEQLIKSIREVLYQGKQ